LCQKSRNFYNAFVLRPCSHCQGQHTETVRGVEFRCVHCQFGKEESNLSNQPIQVIVQEVRMKAGGRTTYLIGLAEGGRLANEGIICDGFLSEALEKAKNYQEGTG